MYRRTSLVSGIQNHSRPLNQHKYEPTLVTPSGAHLAQIQSFSLRETPTTTPLNCSHSSPSNIINVSPSSTPNQPLSAHVRSYVQELRRKRKEFDAKRNNLIVVAGREANEKDYEIGAAFSVPLPVPTSNIRRAKFSSAQNIADQLRDANMLLYHKNKTIEKKI